MSTSEDKEGALWANMELKYTLPISPISLKEFKKKKILNSNLIVQKNMRPI